jgi:hypothetical protein
MGCCKSKEKDVDESPLLEMLPAASFEVPKPRGRVPASITFTTQQGEASGVTYNFVSRAEFEAMVANNAIQYGSARVTTPDDSAPTKLEPAPTEPEPAPAYQPPPTDMWAEKADYERRRLAWNARDVLSCFPKLYKCLVLRSYTYNCIKALLTTQDTPPTEEEFIMALLKMVRGNEEVVMKDMSTSGKLYTRVQAQHISKC